jgi:hypothetical protein
MKKTVAAARVQRPLSLLACSLDHFWLADFG